MSHGLISRRAAIAAAICAFISAAFSEKFARADANSTGPNGVNATVTGLNGNGQIVGMLEVNGRPANAGDANNNVLVAPTGLFTATTTNSWPNFDVGQHAESVASTIISTGPVSAGIAPGAALNAADDFDNTTYGAGNDLYRQDMVAGQRVTQIAGTRAVNMSFGLALPIAAPPAGGPFYGRYGAPGTVFDGSSQFTQYVDWSSKNYNVVTTISGNETGGSFGLTVPTDSYNGLVVGATMIGGSGAYDTMTGFNVINQLPNAPGQPAQLRRTIDIVAPGAGLQDAALQTPPNPPALVTDNGTSFASPHVAGAAALLAQESVNKGMGVDARNQDVMKAVILNSADKIQGVLGMDHTIFRGTVATNNTGGTDATGAGNNWVQQRQAEVAGGINRNAIPLDTQLGVGQLNVRRGVIQLDAGEQKPGPVNYIGWDANVVAAGNTSKTYALPPIAAGQWLSATLVWDRQVALNDTLQANGKFDAETYIHLNGAAPQAGGPFAYAAGDALNDVNGNATWDNITESFSPPAGKSGLNDLDLFILPHGDTNLADAIATSNSSLYSLEHIFFQLPAGLGTNLFDIEVLARDLTQTTALSQDFGLAWWTAVVPEPASFVLAMMGVASIIVARRCWR